MEKMIILLLLFSNILYSEQCRVHFSKDVLLIGECFSYEKDIIFTSILDFSCKTKSSKKYLKLSEKSKKEILKEHKITKIKNLPLCRED